MTIGSETESLVEFSFDAALPLFCVTEVTVTSCRLVFSFDPWFLFLSIFSFLRLWSRKRLPSIFHTYISLGGHAVYSPIHSFLPSQSHLRLHLSLPSRKPLHLVFFLVTVKEERNEERRQDRERKEIDRFPGHHIIASNLTPISYSSWSWDAWNTVWVPKKEEEETEGILVKNQDSLQFEIESKEGSTLLSWLFKTFMEIDKKEDAGEEGRFRKRRKRRDK